MQQRTTEHVSQGHPDKFADQFADAILDKALDIARHETGVNETASFQRAAFEVAAKDRLIMITGEARFSPLVKSEMNVDDICRSVWQNVGYENAEDITVLNHIKIQSPELSASSDRDGAGDQGIMVGYATNETPTFMPVEYELARNLCRGLNDLRANNDWIKADCKTQVTMDKSGRLQRVVVAVQHDESVIKRNGNGVIDNAQTCAEIHERLKSILFIPILKSAYDPEKITVNGTGSFLIGGTIGDAGVVGRKIVVDAYGPRIPVGGGAYSGKDPTKVDRSAAYMARHIAKTATAMGIKNAKAVTVQLAYCIGKTEPEMISAYTEAGVDISDWVVSRFKDLSPKSIIERFDLWRSSDSSWCYQDTASFGHYGRNDFPWENIADVSD